MLYKICKSLTVLEWFEKFAKLYLSVKVVDDMWTLTICKISNLHKIAGILLRQQQVQQKSVWNHLKQ